MDSWNKSPRRKFLEKIAAGAAALGILSIPSPLKASPPLFEQPDDNEEWFKKIKGKHRVVFDATEPHDMLPFVWPRVFLVTNEATGTPAKDNSVVVVLRHGAIPYAFDDRLWSKYKLGEVFKANDPVTNAPSIRNPYATAASGEYKVPGFGAVPISISELQASGVMFAVCNAAMTVYSAVVADEMKLNAADVKKDWESGVLPGIQIVPSGVWAVGRAQEHGCSYIFVG